MTDPDPRGQESPNGVGEELTAVVAGGREPPTDPPADLPDEVRRLASSHAASSEGLSIVDALAYAIQLHREGYLQAATEIYRRILGAAPDNVEALHYLGLALCKLDNEKDGLSFIRRAIELCPDYVDAHNNLGNLLKLQGHLPEAAEAYRRVLSLQANNADALNNLGTIVNALGQVEEAVTLYRSAIELCPDHINAHHNLGNALIDLGRDKEGLDAYQRAVRLRPDDGESYRQLGIGYRGIGDLAEAERVYRTWLSIEPDNVEARHLLAACGGQGVPDRASDNYIRYLFNRFASSFDMVLECIGHQGPAIVAEAIAEVIGPPSGSLDVLDAGCGTGLVGPRLRPYARFLVGTDLSEGMLAAAVKRGTYDDLIWDELSAHLARRSSAYDLIACVDTLIYFGDLHSVSRGFGHALRPAGLVVFTVEAAEEADAPDGFRLNPHGRYGHTEPYLRRVLADANLEILAITSAELRKERHQPVQGWVVRARRTPSNQTGM